MTLDEVRALEGSNPALLADGTFAMLIIFPSEDGQCGLQVPGEEGIRWVLHDELNLSGRALYQTGAWSPSSRPASFDLGQKILAAAWERERGPITWKMKF